LSSIESAERKIGKPPSSIEVLIELNKNNPMVPIKDGWECCGVLTSILREDKIFASEGLSNWSTRRQEGFKHYSEIF
jgi:hypothetical protein